MKIKSKLKLKKTQTAAITESHAKIPSLNKYNYTNHFLFVQLNLTEAKCLLLGH